MTQKATMTQKTRHTNNAKRAQIKRDQKLWKNDAKFTWNLREIYVKFTRNFGRSHRHENDTQFTWNLREIYAKMTEKWRTKQDTHIHTWCKKRAQIKQDTQMAHKWCKSDAKIKNNTKICENDRKITRKRSEKDAQMTHSTWNLREIYAKKTWKLEKNDAKNQKGPPQIK